MLNKEPPLDGMHILVKLILKDPASYIFEENVKFSVLLWVHSSLEQWKEYVLQCLGKIKYQFL